VWEGIPCKMGAPCGRDSLTPLQRFLPLMMLGFLYFWSVKGNDRFYDNYDRVLVHSYDSFMTDSLHDYDRLLSWKNM
jgi:hypothetical protein